MKFWRQFGIDHPVRVYCVLAIGFSWSYWLALLASGRRVEPGSTATHLPGLAGPFLAAVCATAWAEGSQGLRALLRRCIRLPRPVWRSSALALSPLFAGAALLAALAALGRGVPSAAAFNTYPGTVDAWSLPANIALALLFNGIGEEAGWRGFLLPHLVQRHARLRACLLVAAVWMLWHVPLFFVQSNLAALWGPSIIGWAIGLVAGAIVLGALYFATDSVLVVAVWHVAFNFMVATTPGTGLVAAVLSTVVMAAAVVIAIAWSRRGVPIA